MLDDEVIRPLDNPIYPEGAVFKQSTIADQIILKFEGPAKVYNSEKDAINALAVKEIENGSIIVILYEGPKGGPEMPEFLVLTASLMFLKNLDKVALITDGRFSRTTKGPCIEYICTEAYVGGRIAVISDGDLIKINNLNRRLNVALSNDEIQVRLQK
ncbi:MAG: dihydroxy-acid dehydratase [Promethearchaeota archaeon]